jgi:hypothetical protein
MRTRALSRLEVSAVSEESWHQARLIPTSGISGAEEQERRATSAVLAVVSVVKEFGRSVLGPVGAISGTVETFIEVPFRLGDRRLYPDGLIRVSRGGRSWTALVEVKTGKNELQAEQLDAYLDIAREQGFDALITISNEIPPIAGQHPTRVDKRKLRKVALHHWSWAYILSTAVLQKEHRGISDPEQAWILGELIRYLEHPRSGALELDDMGASWVSVREAAASGTLRAGDKTAPDVVARFDALLRFASLRLGLQLGTDVLPVLTRKELAEPTLRTQALLSGLVGSGTLTGAIRIPNAVAPINLVADLRAGRITCYSDVDAPREGRASTRVNWLVRQLKSAPDSARLEAFVANARGPGITELLGKVREDATLLIADPKKDIRTLRVSVSAPMGSKRGIGRGAFIDSVLELVDAFYGDVLQHLKAWSAAPPRMRDSVPPLPEQPAALTSTALSSQDGPEPVSSSPDESPLPGGTETAHVEPQTSDEYDRAGPTARNLDALGDA